MKLEFLQLISPSLPVGAFSYSEGLEWLVQNQKVYDETTLFNWIESELSRGQITIEASSIAHIMRDLEHWNDHKDVQHKLIIEEWNSWLGSLRDSPDIRSQQIQMGESLLQLLIDLDHPLPGNEKKFIWPIAWAWAGVCWDIPQIDLVEGFLYSWVANQLSAALRLLSLGPTKAQQLQMKSLRLIKSQASCLLQQNPKEIWVGDVGAIMAQQSHIELYSRLFRS
ncbi:urease accessory protein UreF [Prochlorococcus marinus]|uniref:urease accessory protein UreF n=1 Tax=Prochlorococcus marinus TaxID=1219 RepID=UPI0022B3ADE9|nr:urease accessory UreF family protein [Prochlorococcus marinus]